MRTQLKKIVIYTFSRQLDEKFCEKKEMNSSMALALGNRILNFTCQF
jgi:hypothetical protein